MRKIFVDPVDPSVKNKECVICDKIVENGFHHIKYKEPYDLNYLNHGWVTINDIVMCPDCYEQLKDEMCSKKQK